MTGWRKRQILERHTTMRLPEQRLYDWLQRRIGHAVHATRVENRVKRDTPDLYLAFPGWHGWIEMKVVGDYPLRAKTPIRLGHWTTGQRYWAERHQSSGGRIALLVEFATTGDVFLFRGGDAALQIDKWTRAEWEKNAVWHSNRNATSQQVLDGLRLV